MAVQYLHPMHSSSLAFYTVHMRTLAYGHTAVSLLQSELSPQRNLGCDQACAVASLTTKYVD